MSHWLDIKYATRQLRKKPLFTLTSVLIVAIGLSLTLFTFSLLNQLIFKPLLLNGNGPLIAISGEYSQRYGRGLRADPWHLNQISKETRLLDGMSLYHSGVRTISGLSDGAASTRVHLTYSQWNFFEVAGEQPLLGRGFSPEDQVAGAESVIVLSYDTWQNLFHGNADIIGEVVEVEAIPKRVIGVMPEGFAFPAVSQVWQSMRDERMYPLEPSNRGGLHAVGKLKSGVSLGQFQQELRAILHKQFQDLPQEFNWRATSTGGYIRAFPFKLSHDAVSHHYSVFVAMMIVVSLILMLTCINIGNLLLARVNERIKDVAVSIALGIPKTRLVLQMLWESVFISCLGGFLAYFLANWGVQLTNSVFDRLFSLSDERPFWWQLNIGIEGVSVLVATTIAMILLTGFIPAWRAVSGDINAVLRDGTRGALGRKAGRLNKALVVTEISLSCVVLVVATMLLSTSYFSQKADYGVQTENRITGSMRLAWGTYPWNEGALEAQKKRRDFYYRLKDELEQLPNIQQVGYFSSLPGTGGGTTHFEIQGREALVFNENPAWNFETVSRDAWSAVGMKLLEGRNFDFRDLEAEEEPVIINAALARDLFPNGDAIGQRVRSVTEDWQTEWRTIIGVVSDTVHGTTMQSTSALHTGYGLMERGNWRVDIVVHYSGSESMAIKTLQEAVEHMNADASVHQIQSYDNLIKQPMQMVDAVNSIFLWAGIVALLLAASGIYAVAANSIALRSQEIATRRALGANNTQIVLLFLKQSGTNLLIGLGVGLSLSLWLIGHLANSVVVDNHSYIIGLAGIPLFITLMVMIATYLPISGIVKAEPALGLREG